VSPTDSSLMSTLRKSKVPSLLAGRFSGIGSVSDLLRNQCYLRYLPNDIAQDRGCIFPQQVFGFGSSRCISPTPTNAQATKLSVSGVSWLRAISFPIDCTLETLRVDPVNSGCWTRLWAVVLAANLLYIIHGTQNACLVSSRNFLLLSEEAQQPQCKSLHDKTLTRE
jgi:hypothetical protein